MVNYKKGMAFLYNVTADRPDSEHDLEDLKTTLLSINCHVKIMESEKDVSKLVKDKEQRKEFESIDYIVVGYLCHGTTDDRLLGQYDDFFELQRALLNPLFSIKELNGKLKWLIVHACRGSDYEVVDTDGRQNYEFYLISFSTLPGVESYRNANGGRSFFIQTLCHQLRENAPNLGLQEILFNTATIQEKSVSEFGRINGLKIEQQASFRTNMEENQDFFFVEGR